MTGKRAGATNAIRIGIVTVAALAIQGAEARAQGPFSSGIGYGYQGYNAPNVYSGAGVGYGYTGYNSPNVYSGVSSGVTGYPLANLSAPGATFLGGYPGVSSAYGGYAGGYPGYYGRGYSGLASGGYPGVYGGGYFGPYGSSIGYSSYSSYSFGLPGVVGGIAPHGGGFGIGSVGIGTRYGGIGGFGVPW